MDLQTWCALGFSQVGKPYVWGSKGPDSFDCSGLVSWMYKQAGHKVPEGSENQFEATHPVQVPGIGHLAFLRKPGQPTHHVGIVWTDDNMLEAHGSAVWGPQEPKYQVIIRPRAEWEKQPDFAGYRRFPFEIV